MISPGEVFPLIMLSMAQHPDKEFRHELKALITGWSADLGPQHSEREILEALRECRGTLVEPFRLTEEDEDMATLLLRVAFSGSVGISRFRIVSRDTLGGSGGCVMTDNLKHYYAERFALGQRRKVANRYWSFSPRDVPTTPMINIGKVAHQMSKLNSTVQAVIKSDDSGYRIDIAGVPVKNMEWPDGFRLATLLQKHSALGEEGVSLDAIGLRAQVGEGGITLLPASPEATMRLTAHLLSESLVVLDPGAETGASYKIYLRLALPTEDQMALKAMVSVTTGYFRQWLNMSIKHAPALSRSQKLKIARWLMPHDSWVDTRFFEEV